MAHRIERRKQQSTLTRARMLAAPAALLQLGLRVYGCRNLWTDSAASILAGITVTGTLLLVVVLAIRKPWGIAIVLLTAFTVVRIVVNLARGPDVSVTTAVIDFGIAACLIAAFTIAFRGCDRQPDFWRSTDSWDGGAPMPPG